MMRPESALCTAAQVVDAVSMLTQAMADVPASGASYMALLESLLAAPFT
jgi:hypothetical protein